MTGRNSGIRSIGLATHSPAMTMAILALLAWKAVKHFGGSQPGEAPSAPSAPPKLPGNIAASLPGGLGSVLGGGGGLGDVLKGGLGGSGPLIAPASGEKV